MVGFPRTCYKCGDLGHLAEACPQLERLCYNCRQPGHELTECEEPKQPTSKHCYSCGDVGHIQADCPTSSQGAKCYTCSEFGHVSKHCPSNPSAPPPPAADVSVTSPAAAADGYASAEPAAVSPAPRKRGPRSATTCYKCGGPNHFARDCQSNSVKCYACGKSGHISKECTLGADSSAAKTCYTCGEVGHVSKACQV